MCDCQKDHPGFECGTARCLCHDFEAKDSKSRGDLIAMLVGDHEFAYDNNAEFHSQIETLADILPEVVTVLAGKAIAQSNQLERLRQKLQS